VDEYVSGAQVEWGKPKHSEENRCHSQPSLLKVDWMGLLRNNRGVENLARKKKLTQELCLSLVLTGRIRGRC